MIFFQTKVFKVISSWLKSQKSKISVSKFSKLDLLAKILNLLQCALVAIAAALMKAYPSIIPRKVPNKKGAIVLQHALKINKSGFKKWDQKKFHHYSHPLLPSLRSYPFDDGGQWGNFVKFFRQQRGFRKVWRLQPYTASQCSYSALSLSELTRSSDLKKIWAAEVQNFSGPLHKYELYQGVPLQSLFLELI